MFSFFVCVCGGGGGYECITADRELKWTGWLSLQLMQEELQ